MRKVRGQRGVLRSSATSLMLSRVQAHDLRPPQSCSFFPLGSRPRPGCFPCVLHPAVVHCSCVTDARSTRRTRSVLCLPMQTRRVLLARWVIRAHMSHLVTTSSTQHTPDRLIRYAVITGDVTDRFPLLDTKYYGRPFSNRYFLVRV